MEQPQIVSYIEQSENFTMFDVQWVPSSARLVVLGTLPKGTGMLKVYELSKGSLSTLFEVEKPSAFKCGTFAASSLEDRHLATGDFQGKLELWDLENTSSPVYSTKAHHEIINAVDGIGGTLGKSSSQIVTGGRDGSVKVWDTRVNEKPVAVMEPSPGEERHDCWSVAFGNSRDDASRMVCAGYDNGDIKMFNLAQMKVEWETNVGQGVCSLEFDRKDIEINKLLVCTLHSGCHVFDMRTRNPKSGFASLKQKAHNSTVWTGRHLPQNRDLFATCGGNGSISLWQYKYPEKRYIDHKDGTKSGVMGSLNLLQEVGIAPQPITSFTWNNDKLGLAACTSFDQMLRILIVTRLNTV